MVLVAQRASLVSCSTSSSLANQLIQTFPSVIAGHSYFVSYEVVKKYLTPADSTTLSLPAVIMAGGCAGVAMWSIAIPPDTIKSRLQSAPNGTYSGFMDCARKLIAKDGVGALWKGFGPAVSGGKSVRWARRRGKTRKLTKGEMNFPSIDPTCFPR